MVKEKEDMDVLDEVLGTSVLKNAECRIEPLMEQDYYLYRRKDGSSFISLVEPEYWDFKRFEGEYIATVQMQTNGVWKENEA